MDDKGIFIQQFKRLRPGQNGRHFPDETFKCISLNTNVWISIKISLKCVPEGPINNIPALVQIMAWRWPGDKLLSEPMMVSLLTDVCVIRPQWANMIAAVYFRVRNPRHPPSWDWPSSRNIWVSTSVDLIQLLSVLSSNWTLAVYQSGAIFREISKATLKITSTQRKRVQNHQYPRKSDKCVDLIEIHTWRVGCRFRLASCLR